MSGATTSAIQQQIQQLQAQQQIAGIRAQEPAILAQLKRYNDAAAANIESARALPGEVVGQVQEFCRRMGQVVGAGVALRMAVPYPRSPEEVAKSHVSQFSYRSGLIQAAFTAQQSLADTRLANAERDAEAIVEAAYLAAAPARPRMSCSDEDIANTLGDLRAGLSAAAQKGNTRQVAKQILTDALADNDLTLLYVLLNTPGKRLLTAMGIPRVALLQQYAESQVAKVDYAANPHPLADGVTGGQFFAVQQTDQKLTNLPGLAQAYFDARMAEAKALFGSTTVQQNLQP